MVSVSNGPQLLKTKGPRFLQFPGIRDLLLHQHCRTMGKVTRATYRISVEQTDETEPICLSLISVWRV